MSNCLGLFYAERLGNCVHCAFIFIFVKLFLIKLRIKTDISRILFVLRGRVNIYKVER